MRAAALFVTAALMLPAGPALAAGPSKTNTLTPAPVPLAAGTIRVDGILNDPAWETAWKAHLPYEVHPGENTPAPSRRRCC